MSLLDPTCPICSDYIKRLESMISLRELSRVMGLTDPEPGHCFFCDRWIPGVTRLHLRWIRWATKRKLKREGRW